MPPSYRRRQNSTFIPILPKTTNRSKRTEAKQFEKDWRHLKSCCADQDSQRRLAWLQQQYGKRERGVSESAQAEIDIAMFLVRAGLSLSFVKEREHRTADLECYLDHDRLFVEVTVIVPSDLDRSRNVQAGRGIAKNDNDEESDFYKDGLVTRILARMREKAAQLADYCAPVLLALNIVHQDQNFPANGRNTGRRMALDLQQVGGVITNALVSVPQVSAVLLTLWNIQPAESKANIRMSNVRLGEWVPGSKGSSQIRLLALNPTASYSIESDVQLALRRVL